MNTRAREYRANIDCRDGRYSVALWAQDSSRPGLNDLTGVTSDDGAVVELDAMARAYGWTIRSVYLVHRSWTQIR